MSQSLPPLLFLVDASVIMQNRKTRHISDSTRFSTAGSNVCSAVERLIGHSPAGTDFAYQIVDSYQNELNVPNTSPIQSVSQDALVTLRELVMEKCVDLEPANSVQLTQLAAAAQDLLEATGEPSYDSFLDSDNLEHQKNTLIIFSCCPSNDDEFAKFAPSLDETSNPNMSKSRMLLSRPTSANIVWVDCSSPCTISQAFSNWLSDQGARLVSLESLVIDRRVLPARVIVNSAMRQTLVTCNEVGIDLIISNSEAASNLDISLLFHGRLSFIFHKPSHLTNMALLPKYFVRENSLSDQDLASAGLYSEPPCFISPRKGGDEGWSAVGNVWIENFAGLMIHMKKVGYILAVDVLEMNGGKKGSARNGFVTALTPLSASLRVVPASAISHEASPKVLDGAFIQWINRPRTELFSVSLGNIAGSLKGKSIFSTLPEWPPTDGCGFSLDVESDRNSRYIAELMECDSSKSSNCLSKFYDHVFCSSEINDEGRTKVEKNKPCRNAILISLKSHVLDDLRVETISRFDSTSVQPPNYRSNISTALKNRSPASTKDDPFLSQPLNGLASCRPVTVSGFGAMENGTKAPAPGPSHGQVIQSSVVSPPCNAEDPDSTKVSLKGRPGTDLMKCRELSINDMSAVINTTVAVHGHVSDQRETNVKFDFDVSISDEHHVDPASVHNHETALRYYSANEKEVEIWNQNSEQIIEDKGPEVAATNGEQTEEKSPVALPAENASLSAGDLQKLTQMRSFELKVEPFNEVDGSKSFLEEEAIPVDYNNSDQQAITDRETHTRCNAMLTMTPCDNARIMEGITEHFSKPRNAHGMNLNCIPHQKCEDDEAINIGQSNSVPIPDHIDNERNCSLEERLCSEPLIFQTKSQSPPKIAKHFPVNIANEEDVKTVNSEMKPRRCTLPTADFASSQIHLEKKVYIGSVLTSNSHVSPEKVGQTSGMGTGDVKTNETNDRTFHPQIRTADCAEGQKGPEVSVEAGNSISPLTLLLEAAALKSGERTGLPQARVEESVSEYQDALPNLHGTNGPSFSGSRNLIETLNDTFDSDIEADINGGYERDNCWLSPTLGAVSETTMRVRRTINEIGTCSSAKSLILLCLVQLENLAVTLNQEGRNRSDVRRAVKRLVRRTDTVADDLQRARQEMKKSTGLIDCEMSNDLWTAIMKAFEQVVWLSAAATFALRKNNRKRVKKIAKRVRTIMSVTRVSVELGASKRDAKELFEKCFSELFFSILKPFKSGWSDDQPGYWLVDLASQFEFASRDFHPAEKDTTIDEGEQIDEAGCPLREVTIPRKRSRDKFLDAESLEEKVLKRPFGMVSKSTPPQPLRKLDARTSRSSLKDLLVEYKDRKAAASIQGKERFSSIENRMRSGQTHNPLATRVKLKIPKPTSKRRSSVEKEKRMDAWLEVLRNAPTSSEGIDLTSTDNIKVAKTIGRFALDESAMLLTDQEDIFQCMSPDDEYEGVAATNTIETNCTNADYSNSDCINEGALFGDNLPWETNIALAEHMPPLTPDHSRQWDVPVEFGEGAAVRNDIVPETP